MLMPYFLHISVIKTLPDIVTYLGEQDRLTGPRRNGGISSEREVNENRRPSLDLFKIIVCKLRNRKKFGLQLNLIKGI